MGPIVMRLELQNSHADPYDLQALQLRMNKD